MLLVRQGMRLALLGIGAVPVAAASLTRLMASLLYDVKRRAAVRQFQVAMVRPCKWNVAHRPGRSVTLSATYRMMAILPEFSSR
jgi:hypothetical protein